MKEITKNEKRKTQNSFIGATINRFSMFHLFLENWRTRSFQTASWEVSRSVKNALRMQRIIVFLHSAEDLQFIMRLYGIEDSNECQSSDGTWHMPRSMLHAAW
jgi:bacterioferritin (cytochrome b1)